MKAFSTLYLFIQFAFLGGNGQGLQVNDNNLNLSDSGRKIENTIKMEVPSWIYESLQSTTGEKKQIFTDVLVINGDTIKPEQINTRGQTTLYYKRKSLRFKLNSAATFTHGNRVEKLKKFDLISLSMDKYYTRNSLAFEMMEDLGLFGLFYTFCDLRVNGKSEGIFMILERPEDWAEHKKNSPLMIRRGYHHSIDKLDMEKGIEKTDKKNYMEDFKKVYKSLNKYQGKELYDTLSGCIDIENYMKWLAFNYLVHNGDYSDEVILYIDPAVGKFRIIPWDYDDLFSATPHEEKEVSKKIAGKLIFSSEDDLDVKIATDPYLYSIYLSVFKDMLNTLPPAILKNIFEETYAELYPYYSEKEIISNAQYDYYKDANLNNLKKEMKARYSELIKSTSQYLQYPGIK